MGTDSKNTEKKVGSSGNKVVFLNEKSLTIAFDAALREHDERVRLERRRGR